MQEAGDDPRLHVIMAPSETDLSDVHCEGGAEAGFSEDGAGGTEIPEVIKKEGCSIDLF